MRIACPHCGSRDAREFLYHGAADPVRPDLCADDALDRFTDYVYLRDNPAGQLARALVSRGGLPQLAGGDARYAHACRSVESSRRAGNRIGAARGR